MKRNAECVTVGFVPANFIPSKAKGKVMKVRLLQRYGQNDVGTVVERTAPEAEWLIYQGRAEAVQGNSEPAQSPSPAPEPVRVEDTSPEPEPPAGDVPVVAPVKRGPGRPRKGA